MNNEFSVNSRIPQSVNKSRVGLRVCRFLVSATCTRLAQILHLGIADNPGVDQRGCRNRFTEELETRLVERFLEAYISLLIFVN